MRFLAYFARRIRLSSGASSTPSIRLANGTERESRARDQLVAILDRYDLTKWRITHRVRIEEGVRPHSHPVLTLNTAHLSNDDLVLGNYLHEQLHWHLWKRRRSTRRALSEMRRRYPTVPVELPQGAGDEASSYLHYIVCYLEYAALQKVLGRERARRVIEFWTTHLYTEIYTAVLRDEVMLKRIVENHDLAP